MRDQGFETIVISNLLDVDEQTLAFWVKTAVGIWPTSIQLSEDGERAIVKIPFIQPGVGKVLQLSYLSPSLI